MRQDYLHCASTRLVHENEVIMIEDLHVAAMVAIRAGHSGAVLLKIYARCIDGRADGANKRITAPSASGHD